VGPALRPRQAEQSSTPMVVAKDEGCGANPESPNFKTPKQRCDRREICTLTSRLPAPEARPENSSALHPGSSQVGTRSYSRKWRDYLPSRETAKEYSPRREPRKYEQAPIWSERKCLDPDSGGQVIPKPGSIIDHSPAGSGVHLERKPQASPDKSRKNHP
jgi:hypothetical protein